MNTVRNQDLKQIEDQVLSNLRKELRSALRVVAKPQHTRRSQEVGVCEQVWAELDKTMKRTGEVPTIHDVRKMASKRGWNQNNARVEYYQWRRAHGIHGRVSRNTRKSA